MRLKTLLTVAFVLGLIFIGLGDSFLPPPLSTASRTVRTRINQFLLDLLPNPEIERPSQQREDRLRELER